MCNPKTNYKEAPEIKGITLDSFFSPKMKIDKPKTSQGRVHKQNTGGETMVTRVAEQTPRGATNSVTYRSKISGPTTNAIYLVTYLFRPFT